MLSSLQIRHHLRTRHAVVANILRVLLLLITVFPFIIFTCCENGYTLGKVVHVRSIIALALTVWLPLIIFVPEYRPRLNWFALALLGFVAAAAVSTLFSTNPSHSFWSDHGPQYGLLSIIQYTVLAFILVSLFRTWAQLKTWLVLYVAGSIPLALIVIGHHQDIIIPFMQNHHWDNRSGSTVGFPTYANVHYTFLFAAATYLLMGHRWNAGPRDRTLILLGATAICFLAVLFYAASARAGLVVAALVILVAVPLTLAHVRPVHWAILKIALLAAVLLLALGFTAAMSASGVESRLVERLSADEGSSMGRVNAMKFAGIAFLQKPTFGWGLERYASVWPRHATEERIHRAVWVPHSHNRIAETAATQGIVGLVALAFLWCVVGVTFTALWFRSDQNRRACLFGFALLFTVYFGNGMFNRESHVASITVALTFAMAYWICEELGPEGAPRWVAGLGERLRTTISAPTIPAVAAAGAVLVAAALVAGTVYHNTLLVQSTLRNTHTPSISEAYLDKMHAKIETFAPMSNWLLRRGLRNVAGESYRDGTQDVIPHEPRIREHVTAAIRRDPQDWQTIYISAVFYLVLSIDYPEYHPIATELVRVYVENLPGTLYADELREYYNYIVLGENPRAPDTPLQ